VGQQFGGRVDQQAYAPLLVAHRLPGVLLDEYAQPEGRDPARRAARSEAGPSAAANDPGPAVVLAAEGGVDARSAEMLDEVAIDVASYLRRQNGSSAEFSTGSGSNSLRLVVAQPAPQGGSVSAGPAASGRACATARVRWSWSRWARSCPPTLSDMRRTSSLPCSPCTPRRCQSSGARLRSSARLTWRTAAKLSRSWVGVCGMCQLGPGLLVVPRVGGLVLG
jgi:hypothetical protein